MRICLRGECKKTKSKHICCLECTETDTCKELGRCTIDTEIDLNKCSKEVRDIIIKSQKCLVSNIECSHVNTCRYTLERFGVFDCEPVESKKQAINAKHQQELQEREELLANGKYHAGDNYNRKIDLTFKDAVIDKQAKGKREC